MPRQRVNPSFPLAVDPERHSYAVDGMQLRDWFAAAAITGLLSRTPGSPQDDVLVDLAFQIADKMMNRRKK